MSHSTAPAPAGGGSAKNKAPAVGIGLLVLFVLALILFVFSKACSGGDSKKSPPADKNHTEAGRSQAPAYNYNPPTTRAVERPYLPRTFDIPATGLRKWLEPGAALYPKLGAVRVQTPSGKSFVDSPGVDRDGGDEPVAGFYIFTAEPPGATRKIEIYNHWE